MCGGGNETIYGMQTFVIVTIVDSRFIFEPFSPPCWCLHIILCFEKLSILKLHLSFQHRIYFSGIQAKPVETCEKKNYSCWKNCQIEKSISLRFHRREKTRITKQENQNMLSMKNGWYCLTSSFVSTQNWWSVCTVSWVVCGI